MFDRDHYNVVAYGKGGVLLRHGGFEVITGPLLLLLGSQAVGNGSLVLWRVDGLAHCFYT